MRAKLIESDKPEHYIHPVRNMDTSTAAGDMIQPGSPLILNLSNTPQPSVYTNGLQPGYEDGLQIVLPSTAESTNPGSSTKFFYGIATGPILVRQLGECMVYGVGQAGIFAESRAASTAPWSGNASSSISGQSLSVDTANNCFQAGGSVAGSPIVLDDMSSAASSVSNPADTRLVRTQLCRAFIRNM